MQEVTVKARSVFYHNVHIDPCPVASGSSYYPHELSWSFSTKNKNISFGLFRKKPHLNNIKAPSLFLNQQHQPSSQNIVNPSISSHDSRNSLTHTQTTVSRSSTVSSTIDSNNAAESFSYRTSNASSISIETLDDKTTPTGTKVHADKTGNGCNFSSKLNNQSVYGENSHGDSYHEKVSAPRKFKNNPSNRLTIDSDLEVVIPIAHYPSSKDIIKGSYIVDEPSTFVLVFDNSYSVKQPKHLSFIVSVRSVNEDETNSSTKQLIAGWLLKKASKKVQGFQKRWATLNSRGVFTYFKSPSGFKHGTVNLRECAIGINHDRNTFDIDSGEQLYHFKAYNSKEFNKWSQFLQQFTDEGFTNGAQSPSKSEILGISSILHEQNEELLQSNDPIIRDDLKATPLMTLQYKLDLFKKDMKGLHILSKENEKSILDNLENIQSQILKIKESFKSFEEYIITSINDKTEAKSLTTKLNEILEDKILILTTLFESLLSNCKHEFNSSAKTRDVSDDALLSVSSFLQKNEHTFNDSALIKSRVLSSIVHGKRYSTDITTPGLSAFSISHRRISSITSPESLQSNEIFFDAVQGDDPNFNATGSVIALEQNILANRVLEQAIDKVESDEDDNNDDSEEEAFSDYDEVVEDDDESHSTRQSTGDQQTSKNNKLLDSATMSTLTKNTDSKIISVSHRTCLPAPMIPIGDISFLSLLQGGKGGTLAMPIVLNEPISLLQRMCEELEYSDILDTAANTSITNERRIILVSAFAISGYACTLLRNGRKPFNPMLGETFEYFDSKNGWRYISEKVSHHPPVMASYAEGGLEISDTGDILSSKKPKWIFYQDSTVSSKFWGKSLELIPEGTLHLEFPELGLHYVWKKITTCMRNVLSSSRYLEHYGTLSIEELNKKEFSSSIVFKQASYFSNSKNEISGQINTEKGKKVYGITGFWPQNVSVFLDSKPDTQEVVWRANEFPPNAQDMYGFTLMTVKLNEQPQDGQPLKNLLPKTDSRYRTDQRMYENGDGDKASNEKQRLEQLQREIRKDSEWVPRWFVNGEAEKAKSSKKQSSMSWRFKGGYWESRGNFSKEINNWEMW